MSRFIETFDEVLSECESLIEVRDVGQTPGGYIFHGLRCDPQDLEQVWQRFSVAFTEMDEQPFMSHDGPSEWEWSDSWLAMSRADIDSLLTQARSDSQGFLRDVIRRPDVEVCEDLEARFSGAGAKSDAKPDLFLGNLGFARFPEWICLVEGVASYALPVVLESPNSPNWTGLRGDRELSAAGHTTVLYSWRKRFGAEISYLGDSALQLRVSNPPQNSETILEITREQLAYCPDLDQVIGDPIDVAVRQVPSGVWSFWWD